MSLKYLFTAEFADGSTIQQNEADVSKIDPRKSMFYDVLNHPSEVIRFSLMDQVNIFDPVVSLDLLIGEFILNGSAFTVQHPNKYIATPRRLIFFRQHQVVVMSGEEISLTYHVGWQANLEDGENVQYTVAVK